MNAHVHQAADDVPRALGRLRVALEYAYVRASRELDLTAQQAELLCAAMQPVRIGDLATALRCDRSNVSRLVDRAASRGLLERQPAAEDGRVSVVRLSSEGEMLASRFIEALERQTAPLLAGWSDARQRIAIRVLNEIADSLECDEAEPRRRPAPRRSG